MNSFDIRFATSEADLNAIYSFRYRVYVEEMGRKQFYADRDKKTITDPLDKCGINLAAWVDNQVVGVIRNNASSDGPLGDYEQFYGMCDVGNDHPSLTSITTRLMLAPEYRRGALAVRLALASFSIGMERGTRWNFIDCNPHLVKFFERLGWIEHLPPGDHPEYGRVHRMRLDLQDQERFDALASPFAAVLRQHRAGG